MNELTVIAGAGAQTSVGLDLSANVAVVRAGINSFRLSNYEFSFRNGDSLKLARLSALRMSLAPFDRMLAMGISAAKEALAPWTGGLDGSRAAPLAVLMSMPTERPGLPNGLAKQLFDAIVAALPITLSPPHCLVGQTGHEAGLAVLPYAVELIQRGIVGAVLIGGVESYLDIDTLHWLEAQNRIKLDCQPNGFVPGEGAGFVLVCTAREAFRRGLPIMAEILATSRGFEPNMWFGPAPSIGAGLTAAFHSAFECLLAKGERVSTTYCDLNGESWRADEWGYAYVRTGKMFSSPLDIRYPATNWGDVGSASGPLLLALASAELSRYRESGDRALIWTASDLQPYRAACILGRHLV